MVKRRVTKRKIRKGVTKKLKIARIRKTHKRLYGGNMQDNIRKALEPIVNTIMEQDLGEDSETDPWDVIYTTLVNKVNNKKNTIRLPNDSYEILESDLNRLIKLVQINCSKEDIDGAFKYYESDMGEPVYLQ
jgi:hypothetical protein